MIEKIILDYLSASLDVPVYMEEPEYLPESYVILEKTGSGETNRINSATIAIQSYAMSLYDTVVLNEAVKTAMRNLPTVEKVFGSKLNSDYNFTDINTKRYRYQAVFDVNYID